jgi:hypothetical protein
LHKVSNTAFQGNMLVREGLRELQRRLPIGWRVTKIKLDQRKGTIDALAEVTAPNRKRGMIAIEARKRLEPKGVLSLAEATSDARARSPLIVLAPYLSEATRTHLRARDIGYLDLTGNVRIVLSEPGLFIETQGATQDPDRKERPSRSLRGAKAGRIVRTLVDRTHAPGVRELAAATKMNAGYVSRVIAFLDSQALVTREGGSIQNVDWPALIRRWAQEAPIESRGRLRAYLEPRGLSALVSRLAKFDERYVITGALAANAFAPTAPARLAIVWVRDADRAASRLALRPAL